MPPGEGELRPFLRWAGGKRSLISDICHYLPKHFNHYYEPFIGGGALFFKINLAGKYSTISDINPDLINCYKMVKNEPREIITKLSTLNFDKATYYSIRQKEFDDDLDRAVRFIYLNRTCWNGLYRVNAKGKFNVPIGKFTHEPDICPKEKILLASEKLSSARILLCDFQEAVKDVDKNDLVYFDPPYTVKHDNNGFINYNKKVFSWEDQVRLSHLVNCLDLKGVNVIISNACNGDVINLYKKFNIFYASRNSVISSVPEKRGEVNEIIVTNISTSKWGS